MSQLMGERLAAELEAAISEVRLDFIERLLGYMEQLDLILEAMETQAQEACDLEQASVISHRIAGVAATFGYPDLGRTAREAEDRVQRFRLGETGPAMTRAMVDGLEALSDHCAETIEVFCEAAETSRGRRGV